MPGLVTGVMLMLGVWLVCASVLWTYGNAGSFDARVNDLVAGIAVTAVAAARLTGPVRLIAVTVGGVVLGGWLVLAPLVLEYGFGADSTRATVSDIVVGGNVIGLSLLGFLDARSRLDSDGAAR